MTTTAIAPTNIAILKYWGKNPAWEEYLIPTKSSISFTVDKLFTRTTIEAKPRGGAKPGIQFTLNGGRITPSMKEYEYVEDFLERVGAFFPFVRNYDYRIASENNFPTSAGFASSASGFAAMVKAMAGEIPEFSPIMDDDAKLSAIARLGSGSATRSIPSHGGVVLWERGVEFDLRDPQKQSSRMTKAAIEKAIFSSCARTVFAPDHWPELSIMYVKVKTEEKKVKSRPGMKASVDTNPLYQAWVDYEEAIVREQMLGAIRNRDFAFLSELIMKASNNLHQICFGTYPPLVYLNSTSVDIIRAVHALNEGGVKAAYTFDAGPNAVVFALGKDSPEVEGTLEGIVGKGNVTATRVGNGSRLSSDHLF
jgi:diphosphomevalonate decarboxylase